MIKFYQKMNLLQKYIFGFFVLLLGFIVGGILSFCSADGIYWNQGSGLISIIYNDGANTITLQDKNIGATSMNISSSNSYGSFFQRGNNYNFGRTINNVDLNTVPDLSNYGPGNYYNSNGIFYTNYGTDPDSINYNLWGGVTGTPEAMQGPCPSGYHVIDSWDNLSSIFSNLGLSFTRQNLGIYLYFSIPGFVSPDTCTTSCSVHYVGQDGYYWASTSTMEFKGNRLELYYLYDDPLTNPSNIAGGGVVRCFKNSPVVPDYTRSKLYGDTIEYIPTINVFYNNNNDSVTVNCNGDNSIFINGLSSVNTSTNTFTPYYNISYTDEDNQKLIESYSKSNLYLENALFKKTYTGDNERILTDITESPNSSFSGYLPTFEITGGIEEVSESGNIFNNFAENSIKFTLSNIPSYIQYVILLFILFFILGFIRKFRRK